MTCRPTPPRGSVKPVRVAIKVSGFRGQCHFLTQRSTCKNLYSGLMTFIDNN
jgi:hypothetical protein